MTESSFFELNTRNAGLMKVIDDMGIRFAIDDFGMGKSSMHQLKKARSVYLKIDRSFVLDAQGDEINRSILKTLINLGKILGMQVIAEGVESSAQLSFLKENDCDIAQGYYFSDSLSAEALETYVLSASLAG